MQEAAKPLVVYLDSSDFSNLSNPINNLEKSLEIKSTLKGWSEAGLIRIRYSMMHIMEALPTDRAFMELGEKRLACIQELCNGDALVDHLTLMLNEVGCRGGIDAVNGGGSWFPLDFLFLEDDGFEEIFLSRQERRVLAKKLKRSPLDSEFASQLEDMMASFPFKRSEALRVMGQPGSVDVFKGAAMKSLEDLSHFFKWYGENWDQSTEFSKIHRKAGEELRDIIFDAARDMTGHYSGAVVDGVSSQSLDQSINSFVRKISGTISQEFIRSFREDFSPSPDLVIASKESTPSLFVLSNLLMGVLEASVIPRERAKKPKASDFGDLMHAMYIPYVDFFRADAATAHAIKRCNFGFKAAIVGSMDELLASIKNRIDGA